MNEDARLAGSASASAEPEAADADPLARLRQATRDDHARIERLLALADPMTLARCAEIIAGFATWLAEVFTPLGASG